MKLPLAAIGVLLFVAGSLFIIMGAQASNACFSSPYLVDKADVCKIVASVLLAQSLITLGIGAVIIGIVIIAKASLTYLKLTQAAPPHPP